ncbi:MAG: universal stress protein, partial [Chloroflexota bacterium]
MVSHVLVPLDGSALAECVLPHVLAVASAAVTRVTLLHVLEPPHAKGDEQTIDPLEWHLKKREAGIYLEEITRRLQQTNLKVESVILEGTPADCVIDYADS